MRDTKDDGEQANKKKQAEEPRAMYFSQEQIKQSLKRLEEIHPFWGTVFLAFKQIGLPEGETQALNFTEVLRTFLEKYYRPDPDHQGFYIPFKASSKKKHWVTEQYIQTLSRITTDTFADIILHPKRSKDWGWQEGYVETLMHKHLETGLLPAFDLAVWLFRERDWQENPSIEDVIETLFREFQISSQERDLFDTSFQPRNSSQFQEEPLEKETLLRLTGFVYQENTPSTAANLPNSRQVTISDEVMRYQTEPIKITPRDIFVPQEQLNAIIKNMTFPQEQLNAIIESITTFNRNIKPFVELYNALDQKSISITRALIKQSAKLQSLTLTEVGPSSEIEIDFASRLNVITGDNALGKTFLMECAWWALTGTWASQYPASPHPRGKNPRITYQLGNEGPPGKPQTAQFQRRAQRWIEESSRTVIPGLCIFAQANGSFALWDPVKLIPVSLTQAETDEFLRILPNEVWDGVREEQEPDKKIIVRCRGLLEDWLTWQTSPDQRHFKAFCAVLRALSPHPEQSLMPGPPTRIPGADWDAREIPTLEFPYGTVPITLCSAGIKRIVSLAYVLVWAWHEHQYRSELVNEEPQHSITLLIDEMEAHLHPFWQRMIVPAIMNVTQELFPGVAAQVIIATHSPLVLASMEPIFDEEQDNLFHLYLNPEDGSVQLNNVPFVKRGPINQWLTSDIFGLAEPRSKAAEEAIEEAKNLELIDHPPEEKIQEVTDTLRKVLAPDDEFWPLWTYFARERGVRI